MGAGRLGRRLQRSSWREDSGLDQAVEKEREWTDVGCVVKDRIGYMTGAK